MISLFRKRRARRHPWDRETPLLTFGKHDVITLGDAYENIAVLGGVGSGKTSGSSFQISTAMLSMGLGGIVLTAKQGEASRWRRHAR